jgi:hypothetical protein
MKAFEIELSSKQGSRFVTAISKKQGSNLGYLDKRADELANGKPMEEILRR